MGRYFDAVLFCLSFAWDKTCLLLYLTIGMGFILRACVVSERVVDLNK